MNLIYIHTHDTGRYISPYGYPADTPHILALARDATLFANSFCAAPTCSPSRASMLTGTYPHQNGMLGLAQRGFGLNDYQRHLVSYLKRQGYHTVLCGIQHEAGWYLNREDAAPLGYDENLTADAHQYRKEDLGQWDRQNADAVCSWLKQRRDDRPFMVSFGMHSTHRPFPDQIDEAVDERYVRPVYPITDNPENRHDQAELLTSLRCVDECVGKVVDALKESGRYEDTVILFTTDHGLAMPYNKCNLTDAGIAVLLMMRMPGASSNGTVVEDLVSHIDVFPTLCDLLGLSKPDYLEGKSFAGVFSGKSCGDDMIYCENNFHTSYEPIRCVRTRRYKYIRYFDSYDKINLSNCDDSVPKQFLMANGYRDQHKDMECLYDLYFDPGERNNLINVDAYQPVVLELRQALHDFQVRTNDPLLKGPIPVKKTYKVNKRECVAASSKNPEDYDPEGTFY